MKRRPNVPKGPKNPSAGVLLAPIPDGAIAMRRNSKSDNKHTTPPAAAAGGKAHHLSKLDTEVKRSVEHDDGFGDVAEGGPANDIDAEAEADDAPDPDDAPPPDDQKKIAGNIKVVVRVRPLNALELAAGAVSVARVAGAGRYVVLAEKPVDPAAKAVDFLRQQRTVESRFLFDHAMGRLTTQAALHARTTKPLLSKVLNGFNGTAFCYGATGAGKTHSMLGTEADPGIMVLTVRDLFAEIETLTAPLPPPEAGAAAPAAPAVKRKFTVTLSYLEIYNETIKDLLDPSAPASYKSGDASTSAGVAFGGGVSNGGGGGGGKESDMGLELREDPVRGVVVAGITEYVATSANEIMSLLSAGNKRRTTEPTAVNQVSSRSHAVLQVTVEQLERPASGEGKVMKSVGKLSLIDLAGSERASKTENRGQRMLEGANINRSLLALANCINALRANSNATAAAAAAANAASDAKASGAHPSIAAAAGAKDVSLKHVPYRNSKLTRLLQSSLGGNCATVMITNISPASVCWDETANTLKYANRTREIKTTAVKNKAVQPVVSAAAAARRAALANAPGLGGGGSAASAASAAGRVGAPSNAAETAALIRALRAEIERLKNGATGLPPFVFDAESMERMRANLALLRAKRATQLIENTNWATSLHAAFEHRIRLKNAMSESDSKRAQIVMSIHRHQIEMRRVMDAMTQLRDASASAAAGTEAADDLELQETQHREYSDQIRVELAQRIEALHKHDSASAVLQSELDTNEQNIVSLREPLPAPQLERPFTPVKVYHVHALREKEREIELLQRQLRLKNQIIDAQNEMLQKLEGPNPAAGNDAAEEAAATGAVYGMEETPFDSGAPSPTSRPILPPAALRGVAAGKARPKPDHAGLMTAAAPPPPAAAGGPVYPNLNPNSAAARAARARANAAAAAAAVAASSSQDDIRVGGKSAPPQPPAPKPLQRRPPPKKAGGLTSVPFAVNEY